MEGGSPFTHCLLSNEHENEIESSLPKLIDKARPLALSMLRKNIINHS